MAEFLAQYRLSLPRFHVLATQAQREGIIQRELPERLLVTKGNVVGLIDRVSAAGWVERRPDSDDRRMNRLYLTEAGETLFHTIWPYLAYLGKQIFGKLSTNELREMRFMRERLETDCSQID